MAPLADILLSYEVNINLFVQILLLLFLSIAFFYTVFILKNYQKNTATQDQYSLEKTSYLVVNVINIALITKILLLPFFTYTLNKLSNIIPGAMCGAGVISANSYGEPLIVLKLFLLIITMLWLILNAEDLRSYNFKYFKTKLWFFSLIYVLALIEVVLELLFFTALTTEVPVLCCATIYVTSQDANPLPFNISTLQLILSFYLTYFLILFSAYFKKRYLLLFLSILFTYISYLSIVYFFSTYVYQLPTHKCPYCLLQSEYYYIGYFIYSSYLLALLYSLSSLLFSFTPKAFKHTMIFYSLFVFFASINFWLYLIINRTLL